jgi:hypothetical protein
MYYEYNDPNLRWRILNISPSHLEGNLPEIHSACKPPAIESVRMRADVLLEDDNYTSWGKAHFSQYGIPISDKEEINVFRFKCGGRYFGESVNSVAKFVGAWTIKLGSDKIAMRWHDNKIIVLDRLKKGHSLSPSFSCSGPLNPTEKVICEIDELAGYDKSIAEACRETLKKFNDIKDSPPLVKFHDAQKKWVAARNQCRENRKCIKEKMARRIQEITSFDPDSDPDW